MEREREIAIIAKVNVRKMWECDWIRMKAANEDLRQFLRDNQSRLRPPMQIHVSGGRVECVRPYVEATNSVKLGFDDFVSLYPTLLVKYPFPKGGPTRIHVAPGPFPDLMSIPFGVIYCKVLAPGDLIMPLLPTHVGRGPATKLMFALCQLCAACELKPPCLHNDEERAFEDVWTVVEVQDAVAHGCKVIDIYEIYEYQEVTYDLFRPYINMMFKVKLESSGWPSRCTDDAAKTGYVQDLMARMGIEINPDAIQDNPGLRTVAKFLLNSLWGKLAQRPNMIQTKLVYTEQEFNTLFTDPNANIRFVNNELEDYCIVQYKKAEHVVSAPVHSNPVVGMHVTAYGRKMLYDLFDKLGHHNIIYCKLCLLATNRSNHVQHW